MKKVKKAIVGIIMVLLLMGCERSAKKVVENYLNEYNNLSNNVLEDMSSMVSNEGMNEENSKRYAEIYKKQYSDLTYKIVNETYDGDEATITVQINVYDLYKVQRDASIYLAQVPGDFNDEFGNYDIQKYLSYKLNLMEQTDDRVDYTIEFNLVKTEKGWQLNELSNSDIEKLHGIYDYES